MLLITRDDLLDAIDKCQGQKNPTATTCIKLAAYYIILEHFIESDYSFKGKQSSEYLSVIRGKSNESVMHIMDNLMSELREDNPELYYSTINKLNSL